MFIGEGAKLVRDASQLAKEKSPYIIFIDEIVAIGTKQFDRSAFLAQFLVILSLPCSSIHLVKDTIQKSNIFYMLV